jgi:trichothecene 3-O-acetyltransferase
MRRYLSIPATYPGLITDSTTNTSTIDTLVKEPLGSVTSQLRSALDSSTLRHATRLKATILTHGEDIAKTSFVLTSVPELDVRLSSWASRNCYDLEFGFGHGIGKAKAVRRPRFAEGAREGLVYFMPRTREGEIAVGVCLRDEDLEMLKRDGEFGAFARFVG